VQPTIAGLISVIVKQAKRIERLEMLAVCQIKQIRRLQGGSLANEAQEPAAPVTKPKPVIFH